MTTPQELRNVIWTTFMRFATLHILYVKVYGAHSLTRISALVWTDSTPYCCWVWKLWDSETACQCQQWCERHSKGTLWMSLLVVLFHYDYCWLKFHLSVLCGGSTRKTCIYSKPFLINSCQNVFVIYNALPNYGMPACVKLIPELLYCE